MKKHQPGRLTVSLLYTILFLLMATITTHAQDSTFHRHNQDTSIRNHIQDSTHTYIQDSTRTHHQDSLIQITVVPQGKYSSILYTVNGSPLSKQDVTDRLLRFEPSTIEYQKYQDAKAASLAWGGVSLAAGIAGAIESRQSNQGAAGVLLGIAATGLILELVSAVHSGQHWDRSIQEYNKHFLP